MKKLLAAGLLVLAAVRPTRAQDAIVEYRVGPKDLLEIKVLEIPDLNVERRVSDNGGIDIPLLGDFAVGGLTAAEVRAKLETTLTSKYVNRANVSVVVKEYREQAGVAWSAPCRRPGSLNISGRWSLLQAISDGRRPDRRRRAQDLRPAPGRERSFRHARDRHGGAVPVRRR